MTLTSKLASVAKTSSFACGFIKAAMDHGLDRKDLERLIVKSANSGEPIRVLWQDVFKKYADESKLHIPAPRPDQFNSLEPQQPTSVAPIGQPALGATGTSAVESPIHTGFSGGLNDLVAPQMGQIPSDLSTSRLFGTWNQAAPEQRSQFLSGLNTNQINTLHGHLDNALQTYRHDSRGLSNLSSPEGVQAMQDMQSHLGRARDWAQQETEAYNRYRRVPGATPYVGQPSFQHYDEQLAQHRLSTRSNLIRSLIASGSTPNDAEELIRNRMPQLFDPVTSGGYMGSSAPTLLQSSALGLGSAGSAAVNAKALPNELPQARGRLNTDLGPGLHDPRGVGTERQFPPPNARALWNDNIQVNPDGSVAFNNTGSQTGINALQHTLDWSRRLPDNERNRDDNYAGHANLYSTLQQHGLPVDQPVSQWTPEQVSSAMLVSGSQNLLSPGFTPGQQPYQMGGLPIGQMARGAVSLLGRGARATPAALRALVGQGGRLAGSVAGGLGRGLQRGFMPWSTPAWQNPALQTGPLSSRINSLTNTILGSQRANNTLAGGLTRWGLTRAPQWGGGYAADQYIRSATRNPETGEISTFGNRYRGIINPIAATAGWAWPPLRGIIPGASSQASRESELRDQARRYNMPTEAIQNWRGPNGERHPLWTQSQQPSALNTAMNFAPGGMVLDFAARQIGMHGITDVANLPYAVHRIQNSNLTSLPIDPNDNMPRFDEFWRSNMRRRFNLGSDAELDNAMPIIRQRAGNMLQDLGYGPGGSMQHRAFDNLASNFIGEDTARRRLELLTAAEPVLTANYGPRIIDAIGGLRSVLEAPRVDHNAYAQQMANLTAVLHSPTAQGHPLISRIISNPWSVNPNDIQTAVRGLNPNGSQIAQQLPPTQPQTGPRQPGLQQINRQATQTLQQAGIRNITDPTVMVHDPQVRDIGVQKILSDATFAKRFEGVPPDQAQGLASRIWEFLSAHAKWLLIGGIGLIGLTSLSGMMGDDDDE